MNVKAARQLGLKSLKSAREADELLAHCLGCHVTEIPFLEMTLSQSLCDAYSHLLERRKQGEPLLQILGHTQFLGCTISLTKDVLIPRQETEILADLVIQNLKKIDCSQKILVDVCTGSGCLAIAIKKALPDLHVIATDISQKALETAQKNALQNDCTLEFLQGDFLTPLATRKVDFIISNPPYIAEWEYASLDESVRLYEPKIALVSGCTGLEFYQKLASEFSQVLNRPGHLFLEIGYSQGDAVKSIFAKWGGSIIKDFAGHDRFFFLEIQ